MTAIAEPRTEARARTTTERAVRFLNKTPIHIALGLIALIWLAPTIGLFVTSFRPRSDIQVTGWWDSFLQFRYTLANYGEVLGSQGMLNAFFNTIWIAVPSTIIPLVLASPIKIGPVAHDMVLPGTRASIPAGPSFVHEVHAAGLRLGTWTVDDPETVRMLFDRGFDAVASNDPRMALAVLADHVGS